VVKKALPLTREIQEGIREKLPQSSEYQYRLTIHYLGENLTDSVKTSVRDTEVENTISF
jgi:hypothetical protein